MSTPIIIQPEPASRDYLGIVEQIYLVNLPTPKRPKVSLSPELAKLPRWQAVAAHLNALHLPVPWRVIIAAAPVDADYHTMFQNERRVVTFYVKNATSPFFFERYFIALMLEGTDDVLGDMEPTGSTLPPFPGMFQMLRYMQTGEITGLRRRAGEGGAA